MGCRVVFLGGFGGGGKLFLPGNQKFKDIPRWAVRKRENKKCIIKWRWWLEKKELQRGVSQSFFQHYDLQSKEACSMITGSMITGIYCAKMVTTVFLLLAVTGTSMQKFYGYKKGKRQYSDVASTFGKSLLVHFFLRRRNQGNTFIVRIFLSSQNRFFLSETDCDAFHLLRQHLLRVMPKKKNIIGRKRLA